METVDSEGGALDDGQETDNPLDAETAAERFLGGVGSVFSDSSCIAAFHHLKSKVQVWHTEVNMKGDVISDNILTSLYRYLCGFGNALLYDPALYRLIYGLMSKLFRNLIGELTRLGTKIIYADFNRIIIHTDKVDLGVASSYVQFLIDTIETKELYLYLELTQKSFHEQVLWYGPENYGAISYDEQELGAVLGPGPEEQEQEQEGGDSDMEGQEEETADPIENGDDLAGTIGADAEDGMSPVQSREEVPKAESKFVSFFDKAAIATKNSLKASKKGDSKGKKGAAAKNKALFPDADTIEDEDEDEDDRGGENLDWLYNDTDDVDNDAADARSGRDLAEDGHYPNQDTSELHGLYGLPEDEEGAYEGMLLDEDPRLVSNWNLAAPLHPSALAQFNLVVSEYMYKYQKLRDKYTRMRDRWLDLEKAGFEREKLSYYAEEEGLGPLGDGYDGADGTGPVSAETTHEDIDRSAIRSPLDSKAKEGAHAISSGDEMDQENRVNAKEGTAEQGGEPETMPELMESGDSMPKATVGDMEYMVNGAVEAQEESDEEEDDLQLEYDEDGEYVGPVSDEDVRERVLEAMRLYIRSALMEKMLDTVDELKEYLPHTEGEEGVDLAIGQQHHMMRDVALNFVKATMHVLLIDRDLNEEVASLRKKILTHLKVKEFSEDSRFHDFAASYVLRDIICGFCKSCKDVDLLKDPNLTNVDKEHRWACLDCGNMLDTVEIENRLLNETERLTSSFLMQDARCSVTHQVSTKLCSAVSHIAAPLEMDVSPTTQHQKLTVLREVARFHGFSLLQNTVEEVLDE